MLTRCLVLALVLVTTSTVTAQQTPLRGNIDIPAQNAVVSRAGLYLAGWEFDCQTGQQPYGVSAFYTTDTGIVPVPVVVKWRVYRPDVYQAFAGFSCDQNGSLYLSPFTGWHLYFPEPPPVGQRTLILQFSTSAGISYRQVSVDLRD